MKKRILAAIVAVVFIAAAACVMLIARPEGSKGILYRVTGDNATAYLLGSIHIGTSAMHPFGDALQEAMADSGVFVFESDTVSAVSLARLTARQTLPEGVTLKSILGDALYAGITAAYGALKLSTATLENRRPWAVMNTLAVYSSAAEMGVRNVRTAISLGVETAVTEFADTHQKQVAYLETIDEIADTMESFSDALTRYLLQEEIDVILKRKSSAEQETISQWPGWWCDGNAEAFRGFYSQSFQSADESLYREYQEKLVTMRNALMAERLDAMLKTGGTYFVTVGLLHLIREDDSIVSLLRGKGYTVEIIGD
ncbi:MAG: TraB/GumN family protein [Bacillota bacterium]